MFVIFNPAQCIAETGYQAGEAESEVSDGEYSILGSWIQVEQTRIVLVFDNVLKSRLNAAESKTLF